MAEGVQVAQEEADPKLAWPRGVKVGLPVRGRAGDVAEPPSSWSGGDDSPLRLNVGTNEGLRLRAGAGEEDTSGCSVALQLLPH